MCPAICTSTSIGCSIIASQLSRPHAAWELLTRAKATYVAGEWVQRLRQKLLDAKRSQNSDQVLDAASAIGYLDPLDNSSRDIGALGQLSLCQAA